jgi:hypothetical protein
VILFGILTPLALGVLFVVIMKNKKKLKNESDIVYLNPYDESSRSFEDLSIDSTMMVIENQKPVHQMQCLENCSIEINNKINQLDEKKQSNETITLKKEEFLNNQNSESNEFKSNIKSINITNAETLPFTVIKKVLKKENSTNEVKPVIHQVVLEKPISKNEILLKPVIHQGVSEKPISKNLDDNKLIEEEETQISMNNPNDESKIFSNDLLKKVDNETSSDR